MPNRNEDTMSRGLLSRIAATLVLGCGCDMTPADSGPDAGPADAGPPPLTIEWSACTAAGGEVPAECADVAVPIDWADGEGPSVTVFVKRITRPDTTGQLWLLAGGPGGSGKDFESAIEEIQALASDLDLYLLDHRGTGGSDYLDCPGLVPPLGGWSQLDPARVTSCGDALTGNQADALRATRTTQAAQDLGALIATVRGPNDRVVVAGASYGTYWLHRYLQLYPTQPSAVVLDSVCDRCGQWLEYERSHDRLGRALLSECAADALCASKLGADPEAFLQALVSSATPVCPDVVRAFGTSSVKVMAGVLLENPFAQHYLPAFLYRLARCEPRDVTALTTLLSRRTSGLSRTSIATFLQVSLADLAPAPPISEVEAFEATALFSKELDFLTAIAGPVWPAAVPDPWVGSYAETTVPMLMINGVLDPQTTIEEARSFAAHFTGPEQYLVELPRTVHGAVFGSATAAPPADPMPCGAEIMRLFLQSPGTRPDTSCTEDILVGDGFSLGPEADEYLWGTTDIWEG